MESNSVKEGTVTEIKDHFNRYLMCTFTVR